jgi:hypothetical protein
MATTIDYHSELQELITIKVVNLNKGPVSCVTVAGRLYHFVGDQNSLNLSSGLGYLFFGQPSLDSNGFQYFGSYI